MTNKVNGYVAASEAVGGDMQFFTVAITSAGTFDASAATAVDAGKKLFDVAVEVIQCFETPVILGALSDDKKSFKFATNRVASFKEGKDTGDTKQAALADKLSAATGQTVTVVKADVL